MGRRLDDYLKRIDELLGACPADADWNLILEEHLAQTSFFQHERLIHLLVTLTFALMELAAALVTMLWQSVYAAALMLLFLVLLVPYVVHYFHLENSTQRLYAQYDELLQRCKIHSGS